MNLWCYFFALQWVCLRHGRSPTAWNNSVTASQESAAEDQGTAGTLRLSYANNRRIIWTWTAAGSCHGWPAFICSWCPTERLAFPQVLRSVVVITASDSEQTAHFSPRAVPPRTVPLICSLLNWASGNEGRKQQTSALSSLSWVTRTATLAAGGPAQTLGFGR